MFYLKKNNKTYNKMHYLIFGKFQQQSKLLDPSIKVYLIDQNNIINKYANRYFNHKLKNNNQKNDVYFLEKVKMYRLDDQYENDGDVIMIDSNKDMKYNYYEKEIQNKSLSQVCEQIKQENKDNNIIIHLFTYN
jgi:hypothetical protein